jgi:cytochrome P450
MAPPHVPRLPDALYARTAPYYNQVLRTWWVSTPDGVQQVLTDDALSAAHGVPIEQLTARGPIVVGMQASTDRRQDDLRGAVTPQLRPPRDGFAPIRGIPEVATRLLDQIVEPRTGQAELVKEYTQPFAAQAMCLLMGLPVAVASNVWRWLEEQVDTAAPTDPTPLWERQWAPWLALLDQRRAQPGSEVGGLVDYLLRLQAGRYRVDGRRMSDEDIAACCTTLLAVGAATVAASIASTVAYLHQYELIDAVRAEPTLVADAVREALRCEPPLPTVRRRARTAVEVDGQRIPAGEWVTACLLAASHDPDRWPDPDAFKLGRAQGQTLAFGLGEHRCPAEDLAAIELQVGLSEVVRRLPGLRVEPTAVLERRWPALVPGLVDLPCRFDADAAIAVKQQRADG